MVLASILSIWIFNYLRIVPPLFSKWTVTSLPTVFYAFGLVLAGLLLFPSEAKGRLFQILAMIGKASYHIFLMQMAYYSFGFGRFGTLINFVACLGLGLLFYRAEQGVRSQITKART